VLVQMEDGACSNVYEDIRKYKAQGLRRKYPCFAGTGSIEFKAFPQANLLSRHLSLQPTESELDPQALRDHSCMCVNTVCVFESLRAYLPVSIVYSQHQIKIQFNSKQLSSLISSMMSCFFAHFHPI
jgi:hypothetical protein